MRHRLPVPPAPGPLEAYAQAFDDLVTKRPQRAGCRCYLEGLRLPIAIAQGEARGAPDPMADDRAGQAVLFVALGGSGWRHVWRPIGGGAWFVRVHHRSA